MFSWLPQCCCVEATGSATSFADIGSVSLFGSSRCVSYDPKVQQVTCACDVDGSWDSFCNFVDHSEGLTFRVDMAHKQRRCLKDLDLTLYEGWHFVFGGDACIQGPGTLRLLETLVRVKKLYPNRVHLVLGEKDLDKLCWTCAAQEDLDVRREELAHISRVKLEDVPESDVKKSFEESLVAGGWPWEYLQLTQLCILLGTTLFIYGEIFSDGVSVASVRKSAKHLRATQLRMVPKEDTDSADMGKWLEGLNAWARAQVSIWVLKPTFTKTKAAGAAPLAAEQELPSAATVATAEDAGGGGHAHVELPSAAAVATAEEPLEEALPSVSGSDDCPESPRVAMGGRR